MRFGNKTNDPTRGNGYNSNSSHGRAPLVNLQLRRDRNIKTHVAQRGRDQNIKLWISEITFRLEQYQKEDLQQRQEYSGKSISGAVESFRVAIDYHEGHPDPDKKAQERSERHNTLQKPVAYW